MLPYHHTTATLLKADHYKLPKQSWSLTGPLPIPNTDSELTKTGFFRPALLPTNTYPKQQHYAFPHLLFYTPKYSV